MYFPYRLVFKPVFYFLTIRSRSYFSSRDFKPDLKTLSSSLSKDISFCKTASLIVVE